MDFYRTLSEVIDMRSFSNLWYWIALAVLWSSSSHWVLGVPFDMIQRARRLGGQTEMDLEALVAINTRRFLGISRTAAVPIFVVLSFMLSCLLLLAIWYRMEFAQAVLFLLVPMIFIGWLSLRSALKIEGGETSGPALYRRLLIHRRLVQVVGLVSIFITSMFGMYQNMNLSILN
ncbi:component of SufBCD complex [Xinfangfangia sp. CPCC 101601]|uniref:Component of SufBCD complex n=1 Tax=Pseudogemmobacter lacusdianii TaxID=3069608 RepID=A0ABU0VX01_9RHOB|nr:component of SufBCD complex [Xinfangfangia sp. CPCC 101601]MDQ2065430.1 component of SufBCD complex [Xinfangfangia sp. CPCC 101601]